MALDPKKIAERKALAEAPAPPPVEVVTDKSNADALRLGVRLAHLAREAVPALLSEREEVLRELEARRATADSQIAALPPGMTFREVMAEREKLLALLREVEWGGLVKSDDREEMGEGCPCCGGIRPGAPNECCAKAYKFRIGHSPNCRLAAFLGK